MKHGIICSLALLAALFILGAVSAPATRAEPLTHVPPPCLQNVYLPLLLANSAGDAAVTAEQPAQPLSPATHLSRQPDFNGDGCADVAIGVPGEDVGSVLGAGMINVIYGGSQGLTAAHNQGWHRGGGYDMDGAYLGDIQGGVEEDRHFGEVLATGDFDDDGYTDLAVGVKSSYVSGLVAAGAVQVIYGSETGLVAPGNQVWTQGGGLIDDAGDGSGVFLGDIYGQPEEADHFGESLTAGDFNGDGYADLAIGAPQESIGDLDRGGAVNVLFGSETGLTWVGNQFLSQNDVRREDDGAGTYTLLGDLLGGSELNDYFGQSLAAGDINGDGYDELVIGVPHEGVRTPSDGAGAMHIVRGSAQGLVTTNNELWHQDGAYRDHDGDGQTDVTIGNPRGGAEFGDQFGSSLVVGNFDGDPFADVAVGVPREDLTIDGAETDNAGVVQVFRGAADGLTLQGAQWWQQDGEIALGAMIGSLPEEHDRFGEQLTTGDFDGDGVDDLAVGTPVEHSSSYGAHGSVTVMYGSENGLALADHQWLTQFEVLTEGQNQGALVGVVGEDARFGEAIMAADLDNDGYDELVAGIPRHSLPEVSNSGAVSVIRGGSEGLTVAGNQLWHQDGGLDDEGNFLGDLYGVAEEYDALGESLP